MQYYEVLVAHQSYHGNEALTYSWDGELAAGSLVRVSLRARSVLGIVVKKVTKPSFTTKSISAVAPFPPLPAASLELLRWLSDYYPAPLGAAVRLFVPPSEVFPKAGSLPEDNKQADQTSTDSGYRTVSVLPPLTASQGKAVQAINGPGSFLLHGITGSGKSRVYLELATRTLQAGKSAMVLTPEIGLTAQLTQTFQASFGQRVYVLHSAQTAAQRRDIWYGILSAERPIVVIGPRSALFAPVKSIGLIVLDEAHDSAYKNESAPHYQAVRVAAKLAQLHQASFVSGSATPSVEDYYLTQHKQRPVIAMHELALADTPIASNESLAGQAGSQYSGGLTARRSVTTVMIDMKEAANFSRSRLLSTPLINAVSAALTAGEQSLLFLNRRGTANVVLCNNCGWQSLCPNCDLTLTYHGDEHRLRCHACGYTCLLPSVCPDCGNSNILYKSVGTKAVVDEAARLFPQSRLQRFDTDLKKTERLEQQLADLRAGAADIIIGTQMIGKGLDLPKLSVVGVINADSSLLIPDYTAQERTFQLISQVAGRVGRGHRAGSVIVQTYEPANTTLRAALSGDWPSFYESELAERKQYLFPPFTYLLKLRVLRASGKAAESAAGKLATTLLARYPGLTVDGPSPAFHPREQGKYSWQLLVKSPRRPLLVDIICQLPSGWSYDIDPINLL